jgi:hypothetical protein
MKRTLPFLLSLAAMAALTGCGDEPAGPSTADVNEYLLALPSWGEFSPEQWSSNDPTGVTDSNSDTQGTTIYDCTTTEYSLTETPEKTTIFNPDAEILWLGALLQGSGYKNGLGSLAELPIRQRAPLTVFIDLLSENVSRTVENPDPSSVARAVGDLVEVAQSQGHQAGSDIFFLEQVTHSLEQASLDLGLSVRYLGTNVTSELSFDRTLEQNTLTAYFVQQMFTTSVVLPQTPGSFFSEEFTEDLLREQVDRSRIGPDNLPTFISSIVWGRMLMLTMTSTHSVEEMRAALTASRASIGSGSIDGTSLTVLNESEIRVATVGGVDDGVEGLIKTGRLSDYFDADAPLSSARPLSYTVRNLADNTIATVSETTVYNIEECTNRPVDATGARYRITLDKLRLIEDGCDGALYPSPEVYYTFTFHGVGGTNTIVSLPSSRAVTIEEGGEHTLAANQTFANLYIDGGGLMRVTGTAWDEDSGSHDEVIGNWDMRWYHGTSVGQRSVTVSGGGCKIRLYYTITKMENVYD